MRYFFSTTAPPARRDQSIWHVTADPEGIADTALCQRTVTVVIPTLPRGVQPGDALPWRLCKQCLRVLEQWQGQPWA